MAKDDDILADAKEAFQLASDHEDHNRTAALDDFRFARLSEQWPDAFLQLCRRKGLPCLTINKLPAFIRQVVNDGRQNKPAIKVHPADSKSDIATARIYDGLIRHIEVSSKAPIAYDTALDHAATCGFGYFRVATRYACDDTFDLDIAIDRIANPFSVYGDPHSTGADSEDWNSAFVVERMAQEEFARRYKGADKVDWAAEGYTALNAPWREDQEVLLAEWWRRERVKKTILLLSDQQIMDEDVYAKHKPALDAVGVMVATSRVVMSYKVTQRLLTGAEVLETNKWDGKYIPIIPVYGEEVNVEGKRYLRSLVRDVKDAQKMFNFWRTSTTELVAQAPKAPFIGAKGAFETDKAKWETANVESHSVIEYDVVAGGQPPQRQPFAGIPAGALQEALNASDDMKAIIGMYDASLGARSNETSGRAINARKAEGDVSTFHFIDNLSRAIEHGGRVIIDLIPRVYTGDRIIRILGQDNAATTVQLGQPVPVMGPDGQPQMDEQTGQPLTRILDLGAGKYDLTVTTGPSFTTRRQEAAEAMTELMRAFPAAAPVIGPRLAKNLDWPEADEIAAELKQLAQAAMGGGQPQPDPAAMAKAQADAGKNRVDAELKRDELKLKMYEAETDRMKVVLDAENARQRAMNPPQQRPMN